MSKKTRSQKIIADLRRKIKANQNSNQEVETKSLPKDLKPSNLTGFNYSFEKKSKESITPENSLENIVKIDNLHIIKKDLYKTLFFSLLVTGFILVLYWSLEVQKIGFLTKLLPS